MHALYQDSARELCRYSNEMEKPEECPVELCRSRPGTASQHQLKCRTPKETQRPRQIRCLYEIAAARQPLNLESWPRPDVTRPGVVPGPRGREGAGPISVRSVSHSGGRQIVDLDSRQIEGEPRGRLALSTEFIKMRTVLPERIDSPLNLHYHGRPLLVPPQPARGWSCRRARATSTRPSSSRTNLPSDLPQEMRLWPREP